MSKNKGLVFCFIEQAFHGSITECRNNQPAYILRVKQCYNLFTRVDFNQQCRALS